MGEEFILANSLRVQSVYHDGESMRAEIKASGHIIRKHRAVNTIVQLAPPFLFSMGFWPMKYLLMPALA